MNFSYRYCLRDWQRDGDRISHFPRNPGASPPYKLIPVKMNQEQRKLHQVHEFPNAYQYFLIQYLIMAFFDVAVAIIVCLSVSKFILKVSTNNLGQDEKRN